MVLEEEQMGVSGDGDDGVGDEGVDVAGGEDEEAEYESDPDDAALHLTMRRREASDDEEGEEEEEEEVREKVSRTDPRVVIDSDVESDGQGGAPGYDDEESEIDEEEEEELEQVEEDEYERRGSEREYNEVEEVEVTDVKTTTVESGGDRERSGDEEATGDLEGKEEGEGGEGEKKENEPFAVPTAGAFYMHDDRFRENGGGRNRRTPGGRKLWESRDDKKWGHDKFEELNSQETQYDKERKRGSYRGRGKRRGTDRGYARGSRPRSYEDNNTQTHTIKTVRGRGPRRYEPLSRNSTEAPPQNKSSGKSRGTPSNSSSGRVPTHTHNPNVKSDSALPRKNVFASSLNSASPPFYPSGSSNPDISGTQKRDAQVGTANRNPSSGSLNRGKAAVDPIGQDRLYMDESMNTVVGKLSNMHLQSSGYSPINTSQSQSKSKGRDLDMAGQLSYQPTFSPGQVNRGSQQTQLPAVHQKPVSAVQPLRASTQQAGQHPGGGSQASSPPKGSSPNSSEPGETDSPPGSSKSKMALAGKGKGSIQGSGRGSYLYNGAHVIGAAGSMGDQNFPGTPALLPVMQFGSQHPGSPAVGMALPGYVAQPQLGFGNSEMAWVPVIAGGAGAAAALGAPYCSPYVAVDGGYYNRPSGQTSSSGSSGVSRETTTSTNPNTITSTNKSNSTWTPPQRSELVNDEFGQRQNKPRRYSEMNFGQ